MRNVVLAAAALLLTAGCGVQPVYRETSAGAGTITPRSRWAAAGSVANPRSAIDGNVLTVAAGSPEGGDTLDLDLGKACVFQTIVLDHGEAEQGFAGRLEVAGSLDGSDYHTEYVTVGQRRITTILLPRPALAQHVRLRVVEPGPAAWTVAELYLQ